MMYNSALVVAVACILAGASVQAQQAVRDSVIAFTDVSVIPMDRERVLAHQTVVVQRGHVTALGPANRVKVPAGAVRIDGAGKFLMPGLADMHVHIKDLPSSSDGTPLSQAAADAWVARQLFLYLANGVTTVRDMQSDSLQLRWRGMVARGELLGPRITTASVLGIVGRVMNDKDRTDEARAAIARNIAAAKAAGYDAVKIYAPEGEAYDSLVAAAHREQLDMVGHVPPDRNLKAVLDDRWRSIEHFSGYYEYVAGVSGRWSVQPLLVDQRRLVDTAVWMRPSFDAKPAIQDIVAATVRTGTWNCPTLAMLVDWATPRDSARQATILRRYAASDSSNMQSIAQDITTISEKLKIRQTVHRLLEFGFQLTKALHDAGAGLLLGTDTGAGGYDMPPGFSIHPELEAFVAAGLTPYQALETGTRNVAVFLRALDSTGTVAVGKRADLILLKANPLQDIRQVGAVAGVMAGDRWLSRAAIDAQLDEWRTDDHGWRNYDLAGMRREMWR